jgi:very-short-patch-repair endonuclease
MQWPIGVFTRTEAVRQYGPERIRRWLSTGAWKRIDRGLYASIDTPLDADIRIRAALLSAGSDLTVVGESAAVLHGFGVLDSGVVHLAGQPSRTARSRPGLCIHGYRIPPADVGELAGMRVTTPARTAVDLARSVSRLDALAVLDAALHIGACTPEELAAQVANQRHAKGIVQARHIVAWANGLSESPMESRLRCRVLDAGLPMPTLQHWVRDGHGTGVFRLDLAWPEYRVGLEYDGAEHQDRMRQRHDLERRAWLAQRDWRMLSVTDIDVYRLHHRMIERVWSLLG